MGISKYDLRQGSPLQDLWQGLTFRISLQLSRVVLDIDIFVVDILIPPDYHSQTNSNEK